MAESLRIPTALKTSGNMATNWRNFHKQFMIYLKASGLVNKESDVKTAILLNIIGEEASELLETFDLDDDEKENFDDVIKALSEYYTPKTNVIYERYCFYNRCQKDGETFDQFLTDVRILAKSCEFGTQEEALIRDRIIFGLQDLSLQEQLIKAGDPSLQKTADTCRIFEQNKHHAKEIQGAEVLALHKMSQGNQS